MYYHGQTKEVLNYFAQRGYTCENYDNPADFVINVLIDASQQFQTLERLRLSYEHSSMNKSIIELRKQQLVNDHITTRTGKKSGKPGQPIWNEIYYVSQRILRNIIRNPALLLAQLAVAMIVGVIVGLVFFDLKKTIDPGVQDRLGAIFLIVSTQMFSTMTELEPLIKERVIFAHVTISRFFFVNDFNLKSST